jgi:hypothetical protein
VQCEDLYELISCLLPEVTASPAQHCTYTIFGQTSWVQPILFAFFNIMFYYRFFLSLFNAVLCIVLPGLLVELCFFEVLLEAELQRVEVNLVRALCRYVPLQYSTVHLHSTHVRLSHRRALSASSGRAFPYEKALIACWMFVQRRSLLYAYFRDRFLSVSPGALQRRHSQLCSVDRGNTRMKIASANELETTKLLQE